MLQKTHVFGLDLINDDNFDTVISSILHFQDEFDPSSNHLPLLFTPNADDVVKLHKRQYRTLSHQLKRSYYMLPDGQFVVWASRLLGAPLKSRLAGSDLFPLLWKSLTEAGKKIMVVAPSETVGSMLKAEYDSLIYFVPPFFEEEDEVAVNAITEQAVDMMRAFRPDYIFLGIRFPKQNYLALGMIDQFRKQSLVQNNDDLQIPLFLLLGASYEFYLHLKKRAPVFVRTIGMEWFYRFAQEPRRLFKRFFIDDLAFFSIFWKELMNKTR